MSLYGLRNLPKFDFLMASFSLCLLVKNSFRICSLASLEMGKILTECWICCNFNLRREGGYSKVRNLKTMLNC